MATSLPFNSPDHPKKQHVKGKKEKKKQIEETVANETGLSLFFECDDKPHLVQDVADFCLEFSFYA